MTIRTQPWQVGRGGVRVRRVAVHAAGTLAINVPYCIRLRAAEVLELALDASISDVSGWSIPAAQLHPIRIDGSDPDNYRLTSKPKAAA